MSAVTVVMLALAFWLFVAGVIAVATGKAASRVDNPRIEHHRSERQA